MIFDIYHRFNIDPIYKYEASSFNDALIKAMRKMV